MYLTSMVLSAGIPIASGSFINTLSLANVYAKYDDMNECVAPESNSTLAFNLSTRSIPVIAIVEACTF